MKILNDTIDPAKSSFEAAKGGLIHRLNTTPDDRINWSPSETCRTPVQLVAHAADSVRHIHGTLDGRTFSIPTTEEAECVFREHDRQFTTREAVLALLETNSAAYVAWLDTLTEDRLDTQVRMPYNLGFAPMTLALSFQADHLNWHTAQLDYVQTAYGDHDWHL
jgi:hypothetical protein